MSPTLNDSKLRTYDITGTDHTHGVTPWCAFAPPSPVLGHTIDLTGHFFRAVLVLQACSWICPHLFAMRPRGGGQHFPPGQRCDDGRDAGRPAGHGRAGATGGAEDEVAAGVNPRGPTRYDAINLDCIMCIIVYQVRLILCLPVLFRSAGCLGHHCEPRYLFLLFV